MLVHTRIDCQLRFHHQPRVLSLRVLTGLSLARGTADDDALFKWRWSVIVKRSMVCKEMAYSGKQSGWEQCRVRVRRIKANC